MVKLYVDGAARGNPGKAGIGVVVYNEADQVLDEYALYLGESHTNNYAEYRALLCGLERARKHSDQIKVFSDSELVVRQVKGEYKVKNPQLKELYRQVQDLKKQYLQFDIQHVPREQNSRADALANHAIDAEAV